MTAYVRGQGCFSRALSTHERQVGVERLVTVALHGQIPRRGQKTLPVLAHILLGFLGRVPPAAGGIQQTGLIRQRVFHSLSPKGQKGRGGGRVTHAKKMCGHLIGQAVVVSCLVFVV